MKPSIPKGTRDFGPAEMQKRNYIFSVIKKNFELFGYQPLETPAMENLSTLMGKYGEEGDKLIFKILNSAASLEGKPDDFDKLIEQYYFNSKEGLADEAYKGGEENAKKAGKSLLVNSVERDNLIEKIKAKMTEKALRYDLTVPFARYVVMNQHNITFPFKRYQIQPVWRADKPQKGRYREFYQCDADIIGSDSLVNELDLISLIDISFSQLNIPVLLKFNNRKILTAIAEVVNEKEKIVDITVAIDKLDKIGTDGVVKELQGKGINQSAIEKLSPLFDFKGDNNDKVNTLKKFVGENETGKKGIEEIEYLLKNAKASHVKIELDITLARGLNYYTGTIFEVKANAGTFTPSILGGGRYDDLTGIFGLPNMSGVGISFGIDRIYDVMEELNLYPESVSKVSSTKLLFAHFDESNRDHCMQLASELRKNLVSCEVYPDVTKKVAKQFDYANKKSIPFVCVVGSNEMEKKRYNLKNMVSGTQEELSLDEIINKLK
ncbi:MAG TPA: histidine--tRNA ligase [Bacteroidia bacterium]|nr:histidine--tRNA ligase [Bacteroidia bacterium]